ncbi:MAG: hypothetical protein ACRD2I_15140 [Vicinamibacterales bacterium]
MKTTPGSASHREAPIESEPVPLPATTTAPDVTAGATTASPVEPAVAMAASPVARPPVSPRRAIPLRMFALAGVTVLVLAVLALPHRAPTAGGAGSEEQSNRQARPAEVAPTPPTGPSATALSAAAVVPAAAVAPRATREVSKKLSSTSTRKNRIAEAAKPAAVAADAAAIADAPGLDDSTTKAAEPESTRAAVAPVDASTASVGLPPVTITGCLEMSVGGGEFRLTDTEGADAPKSRSWRSGFLRKRSASVALVDLADPQALHPQVGKRIAATGLLTSRELKMSSLRVVGPCN